jgi:predicted permease
MRGLLVGFQVTLAFLLLIGAGLLLRALWNVRAVDPGFRTAQVLALRLKLPRAMDGAAAIAARQQELRRRVLAIPGVEMAGVINHIPLLEKGDISGFGAEGHPESERFQANARAVGPGYFATLDIPVLRGRDIGEGDADGAPRGALINQTLARRLWPGQDAVGRALRLGTNLEVRVVGVVRDVRQSGLEVPPSPEFYVSSLQSRFPIGSMVIRTKGDPMRVAPAVRAAVWAMDPEQPVSDLTPMTEIVDREVSPRRVRTTLLSSVAVLALALAAIGLYGVLASIVGQQTAEIGLRMALGAAPGAMMRRVLAQSLRLTAAGLLAGAGAAWALARLMESLLFGVKPTDLLTFAAVAALLLATALAASFVPARRAMRVEPVEALRQE